ncbi:hypothetical protein Tco_0226820 [Tanacetum coccineum]
MASCLWLVEREKALINGVPAKKWRCGYLEHSVGRCLRLQNGEYESEGKAYEDEYSIVEEKILLNQDTFDIV